MESVCKSYSQIFACEYQTAALGAYWLLAVFSREPAQGTRVHTTDGRDLRMEPGAEKIKVDCLGQRCWRPLILCVAN